CDDESFCNNSLLIIEYNQLGLASRNITENNVAQIILRTPGYNPNNNPFPNASCLQSSSVFAFNNMQLLDNAIARLFENHRSTVLGQHPSLGRVYVVAFHGPVHLKLLKDFVSLVDGNPCFT
ncbi:10820_t:CDS:2, partial [Ambispora gerdemannii]